MAPTLEATGCLATAEDALVEFLANRTSVQSFLNVGDATSAKDRMFVHDVPQTLTDESDTFDNAEWQSLFPVVLVRAPEDGQMFDVVQVATDRQIRYLLNLHYLVTFEAVPIVGATEQDQIRHFLNQLGSIVSEAMNAGGLTPGEFAASRIYPESHPYRRPYSKQSELGDVIGWTLAFERVLGDQA